jgi:hypothetical protein
LSFSLYNKTSTAGVGTSFTISPSWTMVAESTSLVPVTSTTIQVDRTQAGDSADPEFIACKGLIVEPAARS